MASSDPINQQIESTAGLYSPATYSSLLSFYNQYEVDGELTDFVPVTSVTNLRPNQDRILFAIGIIPPSAKVTGRILDRSASILAAGTESDTVSPDALAGSPTAATDAVAAASSSSPPKVGSSRNSGSHRLARDTMTKAFKQVMGRDPTQVELQYAQSVAWLETSYGNGWAKFPTMVGSNNWGAVHCPLNHQDDPGCVTIQDSYPDGTKYTVAFKTYPTPTDGAADVVKNIFKSRPRTAAALADGGSAYDASYAMRREKYYGGFCPKATKEFGNSDARASFQTPDLNDGTEACAQEAIDAHANLTAQLSADIAAANGDTSVLPLGDYASANAAWQASHGGDAVAADSTAKNWQDTGSQNAQDAAKSQDKLSGTPLNSTVTGKAFRDAQLAQIKATQAAINAMAAVPPLKMLINPQKFSVKGEKIVQDGSWGRNGPIIEHWGDNQDKISGSGKVAAFYAIDTTNAASPGLTRMARNSSASWANFMSLYQLYRNNGGLYLPGPTTNNNYVNLSLMGSVYIYYDNMLYIGSFDSFNITESDTSPFTAEYSFEFTVRAAFLLDRVDNFTYGAPTLFPNQVPITTSATAAAGQTSNSANNTVTGFNTPE